MPPAPTTPTSADLAEELAAGGAADAVIRLGWEFNGSWYPWAAQHDTRDFVAYWRHVPDTMRGVEGTDFRFAWDVVLGTTQFPVQTTYPRVTTSTSSRPACTTRAGQRGPQALA